MEPGVPFALLGCVQLLSVASWVALAGAALALRRGRFAVFLAVTGSLVLAGAEVATALRFGDTTSDPLAVVRTAGALLLAAGLLNGALGPGTSPPGAAVPGVIVPLAAAPAPALLAGASTAVAAIAALRSRRDLVGGLLAAGLFASAAALALSPLADDNADGTLVVVLLRGAGALLLLAALVRLARTSLLAKVVAAILGGVLAASVAALGVVGTVVVTSYQDQSNDVVSDAAQDRLAALSRVAESARVIALFAPQLCPQQCRQLLETLSSNETSGDFVARVTKTGAVTSLGGRRPLTASERLGLARDPSVQAALHPRVRNNEVVTGRTRLVGSPPSLAVIAIKADAAAAPSNVVVYGVRLDDTYTANDVEGSVALGLSFLVDGHVVASNLSDSERHEIDAIARQEGVTEGFPSDGGRTAPAQGTQPTVHFEPVTAPDGTVLGVIAISRDATDALEAQQRALTLLFATALLATALVGGLALVLGRRTVDPVRRLTAAAARVTAGDLTATADVRSADEVGTLSRTFDTMTGSLSQLTDELRAAAARLQTVLTSMSDGLVATDAAGLVTSINPAALAMVGLASQQDAVGRPLADVVDVRDVNGQALADPSRRLRDAAGEVHRADADDTVPVRVALAPLDSGDGVVLVLRDTTREREVERMKTEFLSNVSHELRTPLTPIRGYAEILVSKPDLTPDKVATFATTIRDESVKMNRVVDLLVDVAAIEAGRVQIVPRPVTVKELVDGRLDAWKERAPERAKDLKRRVATGLPPVMVDPQWVGKALDELVDNAVKYTPPGTPITFVASVHEQAVRVGVRDSGPGIAEVDQATLFTSFEQVDGSATRRVGGLGLGLSFVRRLAEDAGFPLSVWSVVGKGSEFALDLPVSDQPVPRRASRAARRPAPARGRDR
jgi:PAS domain S-box-containing protein